MYHDYVLVSLIFQNWSKFVIFLYEVKSDLGIVNSGEVNQTTTRDAVVDLVFQSRLKLERNYNKIVFK